MIPKSSEARPASFAGFALGRWAFGLRTWAAMMLALYVAFWCQLDGASSAATCVGILALPTRGQAFQKALYRLSATAIGVVASLVLTGLFAQSRDLYVVAYAGWLGLCVFAASFFDGTRAYGFLLSGYTVAIVSVIDIDSPQNVFSSGINRGAAIVVGIVATAFVNDLFAAPDLYPKLLARLAATRDKSRAFAVALAGGEPRSTTEAADLLKEITAFQTDIDALSTEASNGRYRVEAARSAVSAMVGEIDAARAVARARDGPEARNDPLMGELALRPRRKADRGSSVVPTVSEDWSQIYDRSVPHAFIVRHAAGLADNLRLATESLKDMQAGRRPRHRHVRLPRYHSPEVAARRGTRLGLAIAFSSIFFIHSSWPMTSTAFALLGALGSLSSNTPNPRNFAQAAIIGMSLAVVAVGITEFLILDGVDQFPLLVHRHGADRARRVPAPDERESQAARHRLRVDGVLHRDPRAQQSAELQPTDLYPRQCSRPHGRPHAGILAHRDHTDVGCHAATLVDASGGPGPPRRACRPSRAAKPDGGGLSIGGSGRATRRPLRQERRRETANRPPRDVAERCPCGGAASASLT